MKSNPLQVAQCDLCHPKVSVSPCVALAQDAFPIGGLGAPSAGKKNKKKTVTDALTAPRPP